MALKFCIAFKTPIVSNGFVFDVIGPFPLCILNQFVNKDNSKSNFIFSPMLILSAEVVQ